MDNFLTLKQVGWQLNAPYTYVKRIVTKNADRYGAKVVDVRNLPGVPGANRQWAVPLASLKKIRDDLAKQEKGAKA